MNPGPGREAVPGRMRSVGSRRSAPLGEVTEESAWRSEPHACAVVSPYPCARASGAASSGPPRSSSNLKQRAREQGSVGRSGRGIARAGCQRNKVGGGREPRQRFPANTQSGAGPTPPPPLTLLAKRPEVGGATVGLGRAGGGEKEEGADGQ